jgi:hypothetical protein
MTSETRAWDELRGAGGELSGHYIIDVRQIAAIVARVAFHFEVPRSPQAEAIDVFLTGLQHALEAVASMARYRAASDDEDEDK